MSTAKVMMVFALLLAVTTAVDVKIKKSNSSSVHHVGSLVAKASLSSVNGTVNATSVNGTESTNTTEKIHVAKRSLGIDKSEGKSQLMSEWWRIPTAIWNFISQVFLDPLVSALLRLLSIVGLNTEQMMNVMPMHSQTPLDFVTQFMPQFTTPINPTFA